jgi:hypothetical protein
MNDFKLKYYNVNSKEIKSDLAQSYTQHVPVYCGHGPQADVMMDNQTQLTNLLLAAGWLLGA